MRKPGDNGSRLFQVDYKQSVVARWLIGEFCFYKVHSVAIKGVVRWLFLAQHAVVSKPEVHIIIRGGWDVQDHKDEEVVCGRASQHMKEGDSTPGFHTKKVCVDEVGYKGCIHIIHAHLKEAVISFIKKLLHFGESFQQKWWPLDIGDDLVMQCYETQCGGCPVGYQDGFLLLDPTLTMMVRLLEL